MWVLICLCACVCVTAWIAPFLFFSSHACTMCACDVCAPVRVCASVRRACVRACVCAHHVSQVTKKGDTEQPALNGAMQALQEKSKGCAIFALFVLFVPSLYHLCTLFTIFVPRYIEFLTTLCFFNRVVRGYQVCASIQTRVQCASRRLFLEFNSKLNMEKAP